MVHISAEQGSVVDFAPVPAVPAARRPGTSDGQPAAGRSFLAQHRSPAGGPAAGRSLRWARRHRRLLVVVDVLAAACGALVAWAVRFSGSPDTGGLTYRLVTVLFPLAWLAVMVLGGAYQRRVLFPGTDEFRQVFDSAVRFTAAVAIVSFAAHLSLARAYVGVALPTATLLDLGARAVLRGHLRRQRRRGQHVRRLVVVGPARDAARVVQQVRHDPDQAWAVAAVCLLGAAPQDHEQREVLAGLPVLDDVQGLAESVRAFGADAVAVATSEQMQGQSLRQLCWKLECSGVDVLVAPGITDIAGPRIHVRPVAGLPLLLVEEPELSGGRRLLKSAFDRLTALLLLLALSPVLLVVAVVVRLSSPGPALFVQQRCGRHGRAFWMYKFRSMHVDAERRQHELSARNHNSDGVLFKVRADPRVTPVGRRLRRYSVDELPQLWNVLTGDMSLVGPRPPLPSEVERYGSDVGRRLLVKPGLTGLWQVSGRSDLSWEQSVELDLRYVENWSLSLDLLILCRTFAAVLRARGAY